MKLHKPLWEKDEEKRERKLVFKKHMNRLNGRCVTPHFQPFQFDHVQQICGDEDKGIFRAWHEDEGERLASVYFGEFEDEDLPDDYRIKNIRWGKEKLGVE